MSTSEEADQLAQPDPRAFGFRLYQELRGKPDNLVFSPADLAANLAALHRAARGDTARQIEHLLGTDPTAAGLIAANYKGVTLQTAVALWVQAGLPLADAAMQAFCESARAECRAVDFQAPDAAAAIINDWVTRQTCGLIGGLANPGELSGPVVLTSALYLKAPWDFFPFNHHETRPRVFTRRDGSQVTVPMMHKLVEGEIPFAWNDAWVAARLPYRGGRLSLLLVQPSPEAFDAVEDLLGPAFLADVDDALRYRPIIDLFLPRFTVAARLSLPEPLGELGVTDLFAPGRADLTGLVPGGWFLSNMIHQALLKVDEEGTEAAAATADMITMGRAPSVRFDRPFFFFLRDALTGAVLFLGRVLDPSR